MEIEIKKYVLEQLNGQCIRRKRIDVLEFELETLMSQADEKAREVIEAMAFSHGDGEHVQTSDISDITADIAMSYRSAITDQARELYAWIRKLEIESERLDKYMGLLNREEAAVLRMHHFEGYAWKAIAKKCHMSVRTMMRVRETAYHTLEECYSKAQECGIIPIE